MRKSLLVALTIALISFSGSLSQQSMRFPLGQIWGHLRVVIVDQATGREVPARCYLTNAAGESWFPSGALTYVKPPERNFIASGRFQIELPTGAYNLRVERGTEYRPENRQIEVRAGDILDEKIALNRWVDMNTRGWYSGDLHNHRNWEEMGAILLSEDLNLSPTTTNWVYRDHTISIMPPWKPRESAIRRADATHVYSIFDTEIERNTGPGAMDLIGLKSPMDFQGYDLFPTTEFTEAAHKQGGYVDAEKITWRHSAALVALGQVDFAGLAYNSFSPYGVESQRPSEEAQQTMALYYRLLNCGFKLPVSAGTASGVKPIPLGYSRVYVHLSGKFGYDEWFRDLKAGRSFATNGPMLFLTVDGHEPGSTITVEGKQGRKLKIHAQATAINDLERLEVVWKGKVIKTVTAPEKTQSLTLDVEQEAAETGWVAARVFEKPTVTVRFAQTSPVYVQVGKDRGIVAEDAKYFVDLMDQHTKFFENLPVGGPSAPSTQPGPGASRAGGSSSGPFFRTEAHRQAMLDMFKKARQVYAQLSPF